MTQTTPKDFLHHLAEAPLKHSDRWVAAIWWYAKHGSSVTCQTIAKDMEEAGYGQQNSARIAASLKADRRRITRSNGSFGIQVKGMRELDEQFTPYLSARPIPATKDVIDPLLFEQTDRGYLKKVVTQINASYHYGLWDCCAVMCRRLLETLIIEVYVHEGREQDLKKGSHFMQFLGLLGVVEKDARLNLTRNATDGLREFKRLGDLSAHSRMFNAIQSDIDGIKTGMRVAAEELLHKARLIK